MSKRNRLYPDFFVVGAAKAGTTSLYNYLAAHDGIYVPVIKEPNYFCRDIEVEAFSPEYRRMVTSNLGKYKQGDTDTPIQLAFIRNEEDYLSLYQDRTPGQMSGDFSVSYLYSTSAPREIKAAVPDGKIIICLRNPVERAFSHYLMNLMAGYVGSKSFRLEVEKDYVNGPKKWGAGNLYIELGMYFEQVKRYLDLFPSNNVKIFLFEELVTQPEKTWNSLLDFLSLEPSSGVDFERHNASQIPRNMLVNQILQSLSRKLSFMRVPAGSKNLVKKLVYSNKKKPELSKEDREYLLGLYIEDIQKLSELIDRDLSNWLH